MRIKTVSAFTGACFGTLLMLCFLGMAAPSYSQLNPMEWKSAASRYSGFRPSHLALSPTGDRIALADNITGRILVIDYRGEVLWGAGENAKIEPPLTVAFDSENEILFTAANTSLVFKCRENEPQKIDTVANLEEVFKRKISVKQLVKRPGGDYLILDDKSGSILRADSSWEEGQVLISGGQGRGKLWAPSLMTVDFSGKILVTDLKNYPLQVFDGNGKFLFYGGWDKPGLERGWEATAVAVDRTERIVVADRTNSQLRLYDQSGREINLLPLGYAPASIATMTVTAAGQIYMIDEFRGLLSADWEN